MSSFQEELKSAFRTIPDFPKPGIMFKDISPLLADPVMWKRTIFRMAEQLHHHVDKVVGMDARGFLVGIALAMELGVGFVMARKPSKLPGAKRTVSYGLEYGTNSLEMQADAIKPGERILVVDDLLATGGTAEATSHLVKEAGGIVVAYAFIVELVDLGGRQKLAPTPVYASCTF
jgi:adenine phosphoribosyltransferase